MVGQPDTKKMAPGVAAVIFAILVQGALMAASVLSAVTGAPNPVDWLQFGGAGMLVVALIYAIIAIWKARESERRETLDLIMRLHKELIREVRRGTDRENEED
jgi:hypothetical protein